MKAYTLTFLALIVVMMIAIGCFKPDEFPIEPQVTEVSFFQDVIFGKDGRADSIIIDIGFTDGDGNLGVWEEDSSANLFIKDRRNDFTYDNRIPNIAPEGNVKSIYGDIRVVLASTCCQPLIGLIPCDPSNTYPQADTIYYDIWIKDRDGNLSDTITSPPLIIMCDAE